MKLVALLFVACLAAQAHGHRYFTAYLASESSPAAAEFTMFEHGRVAYCTLNVSDVIGLQYGRLTLGNPTLDNSTTEVLFFGPVVPPFTGSASYGNLSFNSLTMTNRESSVASLEASINAGEVWAVLQTAEGLVYGEVEEVPPSPELLATMDSTYGPATSSAAPSRSAEYRTVEGSSDSHAGRGRRLLRW